MGYTVPEAHNPSRSVSGMVCVFVPCCGTLNGKDSCVLTSWLSSVFSIIFVITRTIVLHLKVINFNGHLWYPPLQSAVLVRIGIIFVPKGFCGLDIRAEVLAKQLYRAILINCQDVVSCLRNRRMILQC